MPSTGAWATPSKKRASPSSSYNWLPVVLQLGVGSSGAFPSTLEFYLAWSCVGHYSCCDLFMCATAKSDPEDSISQDSLFSGSSIYSAMSSVMLSEPWWRGRADWYRCSFYVWTPTVTYLQHFQQWWVSVLTITSVIRSFTDQGWE